MDASKRLKSSETVRTVHRCSVRYGNDIKFLIMADAVDKLLVFTSIEESPADSGHKVGETSRSISVHGISV